jgi:hypothetical protein
LFGVCVLCPFGNAALRSIDRHRYLFEPRPRTVRQRHCETYRLLDARATANVVTSAIDFLLIHFYGADRTRVFTSVVRRSQQSGAPAYTPLRGLHHSIGIHNYGRLSGVWKTHPPSPSLLRVRRLESLLLRLRRLRTFFLHRPSMIRVLLRSQGQKVFLSPAVPTLPVAEVEPASCVSRSSNDGRILALVRAFRILW